MCDGSAHSSGCVVNGSNAYSELLLFLTVLCDLYRAKYIHQALTDTN